MLYPHSGYLSKKNFLELEIVIYYINMSVLLENTPLVKFIQNYIRDSSGVFSISSLEKISLKLYLNSMIERSAGFIRKHWAIFENLRKFSKNVRKRSVWPLEQF